jgi:hypothetical protein
MRKAREYKADRPGFSAGFLAIRAGPGQRPERE